MVLFTVHQETMQFVGEPAWKTVPPQVDPF